MVKTHKSFTFRLLQIIGLNYSEGEYSQVTFFQVIKRVFIKYRNAFLLNFSMYSVIFAPISHRMLRPKLWILMGARVGKNVFIGSYVSIDAGNAKLIELEDHVHIASHSILLCHQRDLSNYYVGDDYAKLPYIKGKIVLKKGCLIGTNCLIMPGVTVGEGAIVGAGSIVNKDIPAWTVAIGRPAKVVKYIKERNN